ncbi:hypothetical protein JX265_004429 [Neoarthrinium moseri]|uniref:Collagen-like protein Mcl1 n=1 Tax=Neoarthrinium moseri TaxID=1658444 RepID=A0A9P9WQR4_9PEZI|nr:hypothetical protein JX265_004429 [Neoarthrinium moseri]
MTPVALALLAACPVIAQDVAPKAASLLVRDDDYLNSVCSPSKFDESAGVPPCIDIISIEAACAPNGTSSLALEAHAQCMCGGSYFSEWLGCRQCLYVHAGLTERNLTYWKDVITTASNLLCTGTPTAAFQALFNSAQAAATVPTTGGTALSDIKSGDSAVTLYYTASGNAGPGKITGSATAATATGSTQTTAAPKSSSKNADSGSASTTTRASTTTGSSSSNFAAPTGATAKNMFLAVAGGALMAAL